MRRRGQAAVTEQQLDRTHVGARFQQVGGEGMSQLMGSDRFADTTHAVRFLAR